MNTVKMCALHIPHLTEMQRSVAKQRQPPIFRISSEMRPNSSYLELRTPNVYIFVYMCPSFVFLNNNISCIQNLKNSNMCQMLFSQKDRISLETRKNEL